MMNTVADQILKQFVANFAALVQSVNVSPTAPAPSDLETQTQAEPESQDPAGVALASTTAPAELNGLALAWAVIRDWLRGLFSRKTA